MNAIAPANHWNSAGVEGLEELDQSDFILPRWKIVQATAKFDGADQHLGQFVRNIDSEFRPYLDVVLLNVTQSRTLWAPNLDDNQPECISRDGKTGSVYGACSQCPFNVMVNPELRADANARRCQFGYTAMMVDDPEMGTMALFGASGTSVRPFKILTSQIMQRKRPLFSWLIRLETERVTNDRGKFYVLKPSILSELSDGDVDMWRAMRASMAGAVVRDYEEADGGVADTDEVPF